MTIRAIFFDLDDTLCNTSASRRERAVLAARILVAHERSHTVEGLVERFLEPVSADGWPRGVGGVLEELGLRWTPHGRRAYGAWFFEDCEHLICAFDGCLPALQRLGETYTLGVITNGPIDIQRRKYDALRIEAHFLPHLFLPSEAVGFAKPDPRIFRHALRLAGVAPNEALMVGDWLEADVVGAQNAGMRGVWFNPHERPLPPGMSPDAIVHRFEDLPGVIDRLG